MTEDNGCKVCGKHFEDAEDLKNHGKYDHPEVQENYPDIFDKKEDAKEDEYSDDLGDFTDKPTKGKYDDRPVVQGEPVGIVGEIEKQEDKPVQSHDDWKKDLDSMRDEYSKETADNCAVCGDLDHTTEEHWDKVPAWQKPNYGDEDHVPPMTPTPNEDVGDYKDDLQWDDKTNHYVKKPVEGEEQGDSSGADDPLAKVADLAESYRYMSKDHRASLFESLDFTQGDSAILSGLEWNELTRPIKVEASEAYVKEQAEETVEAPIEEDEEDKAYESLYNLEKYHSSPDFKKKSITCTRCNESFYNINDRSIHFNEVHATEQEYELPEVCPFCNIVIPENEDIDWHMQEQHGAHVPSQFTQTGVQGAMADTDFDALEQFDADWACPRCGNKNVKIKYDENGIPSGRECPKCGLGSESRKKAGEGELASYPDEDEYTDSEFGSTRPKAKEDEPWDLDPTFDEPDGMVGNYAPPSDELEDGDAEEGGAGSGPQEGSKPALLPEQVARADDPYYNPFKSTPKSQLMQTDPYVTRTTEEAPDTNKSELETEIKDLENFINMASYENPLNMGEFQDRLDGLKSQLASENEDEEDEDDNEDYPEGWDKRKPTIGGYDPELDYDG